MQLQKMFDKVFIVAELSANHNGSLENAINTIKLAKRAGADAIKLQTFTPDSITLKSRNEDFLIKGSIWANQYLYELYKKSTNSLGMACQVIWDI